MEPTVKTRGIKDLTSFKLEYNFYLIFYDLFLLIILYLNCHYFSGIINLPCIKMDTYRMRFFEIVVNH